MTIKNLLDSLDWTSSHRGYYLGKTRNSGEKYSDIPSIQWDGVRKTERLKLHKAFKGIKDELLSHDVSVEDLQKIRQKITDYYVKYSCKNWLFKVIFFRKIYNKTLHRFTQLRSTLDVLEAQIPKQKIKTKNVDGVPSVIVTGVTQDEFNKYVSSWVKNPTSVFPYFPEIENLDVSAVPNFQPSHTMEMAAHLPRLKTLTYSRLSRTNMLNILRNCPLLKFQDEAADLRAKNTDITLPALGVYSQTELNTFYQNNPQLRKLDLSKTEMTSFEYDENILSATQLRTKIIPPKSVSHVLITFSNTTLTVKEQHKLIQALCAGGSVKSLHLENMHYEIYNEVSIPPTIEYFTLGRSVRITDLSVLLSRFPRLKYAQANFDAKLDLTKNHLANPILKKLLDDAIKARSLRYLGRDELRAALNPKFNPYAAHESFGAILNDPPSHISLLGCTNIRDSDFIYEMAYEDSTLSKVASLDLRGTSVSLTCYQRLKKNFPNLKITYDPYFMSRKEAFYKSRNDTETVSFVLAEFKETGFISLNHDYKLIMDAYLHADDKMLSDSQWAEVRKQCICILNGQLTVRNVLDIYEFAKANDIPYLQQQALIFNESYGEKAVESLSKLFLDDLINDRFIHQEPYLNIKENWIASYPKPFKQQLEDLITGAKDLGEKELSMLLKYCHAKNHVEHCVYIASFLALKIPSVSDYLFDQMHLIPYFLQSYVIRSRPLEFAQLYWYWYENASSGDLTIPMLNLAKNYRNIIWLNIFVDKPQNALRLINLYDDNKVNELMDLTLFKSLTIENVLNHHKDKPRLAVSLDLSFNSLKKIAKKVNLKNITYLDLSEVKEEFTHEQVVKILSLFPSLESIRMPKKFIYDARQDSKYKDYKNSIKVNLTRFSPFSSTYIHQIRAIASPIDLVKGDWNLILNLKPALLPFVKTDNLDFQSKITLDDKILKILVENSPHTSLTIKDCKNVTSKGIAAILKMKKIKSLILNENSEINDEAFKEALKDGSLKGLEYLDLRKSFISKDLIEQITRKYPHIKIDYDEQFLTHVMMSAFPEGAEVILRVRGQEESVPMHLWALQRLNPAFNKTGEVYVDNIDIKTLKKLRLYGYAGILDSGDSDLAYDYEGELVDRNTANIIKLKLEERHCSGIKLYYKEYLEDIRPSISAAAKKYKEVFVDKNNFGVTVPNDVNWTTLLNLDPWIIAQIHCPNLYFEHTQLTDDLLFALAKNSGARSINVKHCLKITDKGIRKLLKAKKFDEIILSHNAQITDKAFEKLLKGNALKDVKELNLIGTSVTPEFISKMIKAYPNLKIYYDEFYLSNVEIYEKRQDPDFTIQVKGRNGLTVHINTHLAAVKTLNPQLIGQTIQTNLSRAAVEVLLKSAYTGLLPKFTLETAMELYLNAGELLDETSDQHLKSQILRFLASRISGTDAIAIYDFAMTHKIDSLQSLTYGFIDRYWHPDEPAFSTLSPEHQKKVVHILSIDSKCEYTEIERKAFPVHRFEMPNLIRERSGAISFEGNLFPMQQVPYFAAIGRSEDYNYGMEEDRFPSNIPSKDSFELILKYIKNKSLSFTGTLSELTELKEHAGFLMLAYLEASLERFIASKKNQPKEAKHTFSINVA